MTDAATTDADVGAWLAGLRDSAVMHVETISLDASHEWSLVDGRIVHHTGRYFAVTGVATDDSHPQPLLEQREIGTLGFLRRERAGCVELLAQGKIEPGNVGQGLVGRGQVGQKQVGAAQLAPTLQATASNLDRVHGGRGQFLEETFRDPSRSESSCEQSEQGTRFLGKLNRNTLVTGDLDDLDDATGPGLPPAYRWFDAATVLASLACDHAVNTDARSVLTSAPWHLLTSGTPFADGHGELAEPLARSYAIVRPGACDDARRVITGVAAAAPRPRGVPVDSLDGWRFDPAAGLTLDGAAYGVRHIAVETDARETSAWDQPVVDSHGPGRADLDLVVSGGVAYVVLVARSEPGLLHVAELGPTRVVEPGAVPGHSGRSTPADVAGAVLASVRQSDEGGRFYRDVTEYRVLRRDEPDDDPAAVVLTLGEVQELLLAGGVVTNEARSALSLLLTRL